MHSKLVKSTIASFMSTCLFTGCIDGPAPDASEDAAALSDGADESDDKFFWSTQPQTTNPRPAPLTEVASRTCNESNDKYYFSSLKLVNNRSRNMKVTLGLSRKNNESIVLALSKGTYKHVITVPNSGGNQTAEPDRFVTSEHISISARKSVTSPVITESFIPRCTGTSQTYVHKASQKKTNGVSEAFEVHYECSYCRPEEEPLPMPACINGGTNPLHRVMPQDTVWGATITGVTLKVLIDLHMKANAVKNPPGIRLKLVNAVVTFVNFLESAVPSVDFSSYISGDTAVPNNFKAVIDADELRDAINDFRVGFNDFNNERVALYGSPASTQYKTYSELGQMGRAFLSAWWKAECAADPVYTPEGMFGEDGL